MKILFNAMTLSKGGAERVINVLANAMSKNNEVFIIAHMKSSIDYEFNSNITIQFLSDSYFSKISKKISRFSLKKIFELKKIITKINPDIIISFLPEPSLRILMVKKFFKKNIKCPLIVSERNDPNVEYSNKIFNVTMRKLFPLADGFVFQTSDAQMFFKEIINCKQRIILNPLDDSFVNFSRYPKKRNKEIVSVGRLEKQKNHILLIDSFKIFLEEHNDYVLKIYGEGSEKNNIQDYIDKNDLQKKVFLMGNVANVIDAINKSAIFVLSSAYEGLPNALIEAMALGIPSISTDCPCGGPKMIIDNEKNGILVPVNDKQKLADAMSMIVGDTVLQNTLSDNCRKIKSELSLDVILKEWIDFINEVKRK